MELEIYLRMSATESETVEDSRFYERRLALVKIHIRSGVIISNVSTGRNETGRSNIPL